MSWGRFGLHFGNPGGSSWPSFWRLVLLKMRKSQHLQTVHTKTLIFRVPEASRGSFFDEKRPGSQERAGARSEHPKIAPRALLESFRGSKKSLCNFQKRPRRISRPFFTQMGSPRGLPEEPPGRSRVLPGGQGAPRGPRRRSGSYF